MTKCDHCKMNVEIRNPSGFCDHLYYPEYCKTCQQLKQARAFVKRFNQKYASVGSVEFKKFLSK